MGKLFIGIVSGVAITLVAAGAGTLVYFGVLAGLHILSVLI